MEDRLDEALSPVKDELAPEFREFLDAILEIKDNVAYYDYNDFSDWIEDETEDGCEAYVRAVLSKYLR